MLGPHRASSASGRTSHPLGPRCARPARIRPRRSARPTRHRAHAEPEQRRRGQAVLPHLVQQRRAGDAEQVRGLALVAAGVPQRQRDVPPLRGLERIGRAGAAGASASRRRRKSRSGRPRSSSSASKPGQSDGRRRRRRVRRRHRVMPTRSQHSQQRVAAVRGRVRAPADACGSCSQATAEPRRETAGAAVIDPDRHSRSGAAGRRRARAGLVAGRRGRASRLRPRRLYAAHARQPPRQALQRAVLAGGPATRSPASSAAPWRRSSARSACTTGAAAQGQPHPAVAGAAIVDWRQPPSRPSDDVAPVLGARSTTGVSEFAGPRLRRTLDLFYADWRFPRGDTSNARPARPATTPSSAGCCGIPAKWPPSAAPSPRFAARTPISCSPAPCSTTSASSRHTRWERRVREPPSAASLLGHVTLGMLMLDRRVAERTRRPAPSASLRSCTTSSRPTTAGRSSAPRWRP